LRIGAADSQSCALHHLSHGEHQGADPVPQPRNLVEVLVRDGVPVEFSQGLLGVLGVARRCQLPACSAQASAKWSTRRAS